MATINVDDISLEYEFWGPPETDLPHVVLLHEASGSALGWRDFGQRLAEATGCRVFAWSRQGHGGSDPLTTPLARGYLEHEALDVLPAVREQLQLREVVLVGLQDGATIGLIHAGGADQPTLGVAALSPLLFVDDVTQRAVEVMSRQLQNPSVRDALAETAGRQDETFAQWAKLWRSYDFQGWHVDDYLRMITGKVLGARGERDLFSSPDHLERLKGLCAHVEAITLEGCRHEPHRERPGVLTSALVGFIRECAASR